MPGVKEGGDGVGGAAAACGGAQGDGPASASARETKGSTRFAWADLLKRVFATDVLECPRCAGRMRIIATVMDPEAVRKILACIGLPTRGPRLAPPREREQGEFGFGV